MRTRNKPNRISIVNVTGVTIALGALGPTIALSQSTSGYDNADCNASFQLACISIDSTELSFSGSAAPMPIIGGQIWEVLAIGLVFVAALLWRNTRSQ